MSLSCWRANKYPSCAILVLSRVVRHGMAASRHRQDGRRALALWQNFRDMENAGAFSVEAEVICDRVMAEISKRTTLITSSLGSGAWADIIYQFQNDICGEQPKAPATPAHLETSTGYRNRSARASNGTFRLPSGSKFRRLPRHFRNRSDRGRRI